MARCPCITPPGPGYGSTRSSARDLHMHQRQPHARGDSAGSCLCSDAARLPYHCGLDPTAFIWTYLCANKGYHCTYMWTTVMHELSS